MSQLFKELKKGFKEMIAHEKGEITLRSELIEIPPVKGVPTYVGPKK